MQITDDIQTLRATIAAWRAAGARIAFVPTMGNLHAGHLRLVETARQRCDRVVVSIFVNPLQFGPNEDLASYPRTPEQDAAALRAAAADLLFMPSVETMYPRPLPALTRVSVPHLNTILEGQHRPGHLDGVTTVVARLFNLVGPDIALFGQKDYQQLVIVRRMVADLGWPIEILGVPIVREADGLAMSSRNAYLSAQERAVAPLLQQTLVGLTDRLEGGAGDQAILLQQALEQLQQAGFRTDYIHICARDLQPATAQDRDLVVLAAAWLGRTRLLDNRLVSLP